MINMARLRFPGRPGQRFGRSLIRFMPEEARNCRNRFFNLTANIQKNLRAFYDLFGDSDEEDNFPGFTESDIGSPPDTELTEAFDDGDFSPLFELPTAGKVSTRMECVQRGYQALSPTEKTRSRLTSVVRRSYLDMHRGTDGTQRKTVKRPPKVTGKDVLNKVKNVKMKAKDKLPKVMGQVVVPGVPQEKKRKAITFRFKLMRDGKRAKILSSPEKRALDKSLEKAAAGKAKKNLAKGLLAKARQRKVQKVSPDKDSKGVKGKRSVKMSRKLAGTTGVANMQFLQRTTSPTPGRVHPLQSSSPSPSRITKQFVLPQVSSRSSRVIKPSKRFIEEIDTARPSKQPRLDFTSTKDAKGHLLSSGEEFTSPDVTQKTSLKEKSAGAKTELFKRPKVVSTKVKKLSDEKHANKPKSRKSYFDTIEGSGSDWEDDPSVNKTSLKLITGKVSDKKKKDRIKLKKAKLKEKKLKEKKLKAKQKKLEMKKKKKKKELEKGVSDLDISDYDGIRSGAEADEDSESEEELTRDKKWTESEKKVAKETLQQVKKAKESPSKLLTAVMDLKGSPQKSRKSMKKKLKQEAKRLKKSYKELKKSIDDAKNKPEPEIVGGERIPILEALDDLQRMNRLKELAKRHKEVCKTLKKFQNANIPVVVEKPKEIKKKKKNLADKILKKAKERVVSVDTVIPKRISREQKENLGPVKSPPNRYGLLKSPPATALLAAKNAAASEGGSSKAIADIICRQMAEAMEADMSPEQAKVASQRVSHTGGGGGGGSCRMAEAMEADMSPEQAKVASQREMKRRRQELKRQKQSQSNRGPRIKHVSRRASVALGYSPATYTAESTEESAISDFALSALSPVEKLKLFDPKSETTRWSSDDDGAKMQVEDKDFVPPSVKPTTIKKKLPLGRRHPISKKHPFGPKKFKPLKRLKPAISHLNQAVVQQPNIQSILEGFGQSAPEELQLRDPVNTSLLPSLPGLRKKYKSVGKGLRGSRCKVCPGCLVTDDCGTCEYCIDKPKYGGPGRKKQACIHRKCANLKNTKKNMALLHRKLQEAAASSGEATSGSEIPSGSTITESPQAGSIINELTSFNRVLVPAPPDSPGSNYSSSPGAGSAVGSLVPGPSGTGPVGPKIKRPSAQGMAKMLLRGDKKKKGAIKELDLCRNSPSPPPPKLKLSIQQELSKHLIKIDFKEEYDLDIAWMRGLSVISSQPMIPRTICYLCGSTGKHELMYCNVCCEPFHEFCLDEDDRPLEGDLDKWCCRMCKFCYVCGRQDHLLTCAKCQTSYHAECLGPNYPTKPSKRRHIWLCTKCVKCKSCGATTPGQHSSAQWSHDFSLCQDCGKLFEKGNYCPICKKCYEDDDYVSNMMECNKCKSWVHAKCEGLSDDMYHILTDLPDTVPYICVVCDPVRPAKWQIEMAEEMQAGFLNVMTAMFSCKSASHLIWPDKRKNRSNKGRSSTESSRRATASPALSDVTSRSRCSTPLAGSCDSDSQHTPINTRPSSRPGSAMSTRSDKMDSDRVGTRRRSRDSDALSVISDKVCTRRMSRDSDANVSLDLPDSRPGSTLPDSRPGSALPDSRPGSAMSVSSIKEIGRTDSIDDDNNKCKQSDASDLKGGTSLVVKQELLKDYEEKTDDSFDKMDTTSATTQDEKSVTEVSDDVQLISEHHTGDITQSKLDTQVKDNSSKSGDHKGDERTKEGETVDISVDQKENVSSDNERTNVTVSETCQMSTPSVPEISSVNESVLTPVEVEAEQKSGGAPVELEEKSGAQDVNIAESKETMVIDSTREENQSKCVDENMDVGRTDEINPDRTNNPCEKEKKASGEASKTDSCKDASVASQHKSSQACKTAEDEQAGKSNEDAPVDKSSEDMQVDKSSKDESNEDNTQVCKSSEDTQVCKSSEDPQIDKSSEDSQLDESSKDPQVVKTSEDSQINKSSEDSQLDKSSEDKSSEEAQVRKSSEDKEIKSSDVSEIGPQGSSISTNEEQDLGSEETKSESNNNSDQAAEKMDTSENLNVSVTEKTLTPGTLNISLTESTDSAPETDYVESAAKATLESRRFTRLSNPSKASVRPAGLPLVQTSNPLLPKICSPTPIPLLPPQMSSPPPTSNMLVSSGGASNLGDESVMSLLDSVINQVMTGQPLNSLVVELQPDQNQVQIQPMIVSPPSVKAITAKPEENHPKDFQMVKAKVQAGAYESIVDFCDDCVRIIQISISRETSQTIHKNTRVAKTVFTKVMEKMFPWFKVKGSLCWEESVKYPDGMLLNAVLPPHKDHEYAQWKHIDQHIPNSLQPSPLKKFTPISISKTSDTISEDSTRAATPPPDPSVDDLRRCSLCGQYSDDDPNFAGRLLYCGQNDWIHINCALWSAEVYEEVDGSLINVHTAISRGRHMKCDFCSKNGATVGCCTPNCPANYHFMCARKVNALFQEDKKVFCARHARMVRKKLVDNDLFAVLRRVCVSLENMKWGRQLAGGIQANRINFMVGSLTLESLGRLGRLSDTKETLFPIDFRIQRVFWSTQDPRRRCVYTVRIYEVKPDKISPRIIEESNLTTSHDPTYDISQYQKSRMLLKVADPLSSSYPTLHRKRKRSLEGDVLSRSWPVKNVTGLSEKTLRNLPKSVIREMSTPSSSPSPVPFGDDEGADHEGDLTDNLHQMVTSLNEAAASSKENEAESQSKDKDLVEAINIELDDDALLSALDEDGALASVEKLIGEALSEDQSLDQVVLLVENLHNADETQLLDEDLLESNIIFDEENEKEECAQDEVDEDNVSGNLKVAGAQNKVDEEIVSGNLEVGDDGGRKEVEVMVEKSVSGNRKKGLDNENNDSKKVVRETVEGLEYQKSAEIDGVKSDKTDDRLMEGVEKNLVEGDCVDDGDEKGSIQDEMESGSKDGDCEEMQSTSTDRESGIEVVSGECEKMLDHVDMKDRQEPELKMVSSEQVDHADECAVDDGSNEGVLIPEQKEDPTVKVDSQGDGSDVGDESKEVSCTSAGTGVDVDDDPIESQKDGLVDGASKELSQILGQKEVKIDKSREDPDIGHTLKEVTRTSDIEKKGTAVTIDSESQEHSVGQTSKEVTPDEEKDDTSDEKVDLQEGDEVVADESKQATHTIDQEEKGAAVNIDNDPAESQEGDLVLGGVSKEVSQMSEQEKDGAVTVERDSVESQEDNLIVRDASKKVPQMPEQEVDAEGKDIAVEIDNNPVESQEDDLVITDGPKEVTCIPEKEEGITVKIDDDADESQESDPVVVSKEVADKSVKGEANSENDKSKMMDIGDESELGELSVDKSDEEDGIGNDKTTGGSKQKVGHVEQIPIAAETQATTGVVDALVQDDASSPSSLQPESQATETAIADQLRGKSDDIIDSSEEDRALRDKTVDVRIEENPMSVTSFPVKTAKGNNAKLDVGEEPASNVQSNLGAHDTDKVVTVSLIENKPATPVGSSEIKEASTDISSDDELHLTLSSSDDEDKVSPQVSSAKLDDKSVEPSVSGVQIAETEVKERTDVKVGSVTSTDVVIQGELANALPLECSNANIDSEKVSGTTANVDASTAVIQQQVSVSERSSDEDIKDSQTERGDNGQQLTSEIPPDSEEMETRESLVDKLAPENCTSEELSDVEEGSVDLETVDISQKCGGKVITESDEIVQDDEAQTVQEKSNILERISKVATLVNSSSELPKEVVSKECDGPILRHSMLKDKLDISESVVENDSAQKMDSLPQEGSNIVKRSKNVFDISESVIEKKSAQKMDSLPQEGSNIVKRSKNVFDLFDTPGAKNKEDEGIKSGDGRKDIQTLDQIYEVSKASRTSDSDNQAISKAGYGKTANSLDCDKVDLTVADGSQESERVNHDGTIKDCLDDDEAIQRESDGKASEMNRIEQNDYKTPPSSPPSQDLNEFKTPPSSPPPQDLIIKTPVVVLHDLKLSSPTGSMENDKPIDFGILMKDAEKVKDRQGFDNNGASDDDASIIDLVSDCDGLSDSSEVPSTNERPASLADLLEEILPKQVSVCETKKPSDVREYSATDGGKSTTEVDGDVEICDEGLINSVDKINPTKSQRSFHSIPIGTDQSQQNTSVLKINSLDQAKATEISVVGKDDQSSALLKDNDGIVENEVSFRNDLADLVGTGKSNLSDQVETGKRGLTDDIDSASKGTLTKKTVTPLTSNTITDKARKDVPAEQEIIEVFGSDEGEGKDGSVDSNKSVLENKDVTKQSERNAFDLFSAAATVSTKSPTDISPKDKDSSSSGSPATKGIQKPTSPDWKSCLSQIRKKIDLKGLKEKEGVSDDRKRHESEPIVKGMPLEDGWFDDAKDTDEKNDNGALKKRYRSQSETLTDFDDFVPESNLDVVDISQPGRKKYPMRSTARRLLRIVETNDEDDGALDDSRSDDKEHKEDKVDTDKDEEHKDNVDADNDARVTRSRIQSVGSVEALRRNDASDEEDEIEVLEIPAENEVVKKGRGRPQGWKKPAEKPKPSSAEPRRSSRHVRLLEEAEKAKDEKAKEEKIKEEKAKEERRMKEERMKAEISQGVKRGRGRPRKQVFEEDKEIIDVTDEEREELSEEEGNQRRVTRRSTRLRSAEDEDWEKVEVSASDSSGEEENERRVTRRSTRSRSVEDKEPEKVEVSASGRLRKIRVQSDFIQVGDDIQSDDDDFILEESRPKSRGRPRKTKRVGSLSWRKDKTGDMDPDWSPDMNDKCAKKGGKMHKSPVRLIGPPEIIPKLSEERIAEIIPKERISELAKDGDKEVYNQAMKSLKEITMNSREKLLVAISQQVHAKAKERCEVSRVSKGKLSDSLPCLIWKEDLPAGNQGVASQPPGSKVTKDDRLGVVSQSETTGSKVTTKDITRPLENHVSEVEDMDTTNSSVRMDVRSGCNPNILVKLKQSFAKDKSGITGNNSVASSVRTPVENSLKDSTSSVTRPTLVAGNNNTVPPLAKEAASLPVLLDLLNAKKLSDARQPNASTSTTNSSNSQVVASSELSTPKKAVCAQQPQTSPILLSSLTKERSSSPEVIELKDQVFIPIVSPKSAAKQPMYRHPVLSPPMLPRIPRSPIMLSPTHPLPPPQYYTIVQPAMKERPIMQPGGIDPSSSGPMRVRGRIRMRGGGRQATPPRSPYFCETRLNRPPQMQVIPTLSPLHQMQSLQNRVVVQKDYMTDQSGLVVSGNTLQPVQQLLNTQNLQANFALSNPIQIAPRMQQQPVVIQQVPAAARVQTPSPPAIQVVGGPTGFIQAAVQQRRVSPQTVQVIGRPGAIVSQRHSTSPPIIQIANQIPSPHQQTAQVLLSPNQLQGQLATQQVRLSTAQVSLPQSQQLVQVSTPRGQISTVVPQVQLSQVSAPTCQLSVPQRHASFPQVQLSQVSSPHGQMSAPQRLMSVPQVHLSQVSSPHGQLSTPQMQASIPQVQLSQVSSPHGQLSITQGQVSMSQANLPANLGQQGHASLHQRQLSQTLPQLALPHGQIQPSPPVRQLSQVPQIQPRPTIQILPPRGNAITLRVSSQHLPVMNRPIAAQQSQTIAVSTISAAIVPQATTVASTSQLPTTMEIATRGMTSSNISCEPPRQTTPDRQHYVPIIRQYSNSIRPKTQALTSPINTGKHLPTIAATALHGRRLTSPVNMPKLAPLPYSTTLKLPKQIPTTASSQNPTSSATSILNSLVRQHMTKDLPPVTSTTNQHNSVIEISDDSASVITEPERLTGAKRRKTAHVSKRGGEVWFDDLGNLQGAISEFTMDELYKINKRRLEGIDQSSSVMNRTKIPTFGLDGRRVVGGMDEGDRLGGIIPQQSAPNLRKHIVPKQLRHDKWAAPLTASIETKLPELSALSELESTEQLTVLSDFDQEEKMSLPPEEEDDTPSLLMQLMEEEKKRPKVDVADDEPHLMFEVVSDDGFSTKGKSMEEAWSHVIHKVEERRSDSKMTNLSFAGINPLKILGISHDALVFLIEQLYGAKNCQQYKFRYHQYYDAELEEEPEINPHGAARAETFKTRTYYDMFNFLASRHRKRPQPTDADGKDDTMHKSARRATSIPDLPMAMRFRHLKETAKEAVGVYRSRIHGRGLFCKRPIDAGEMIIEYTGTVIRSILTDKREKYYESKGIGCYMFRIDDYDVIDATMHGSAARFINHSCEPNCFSRVIQVGTSKHIVIFASRKIYTGEELTYDYKFPIEDDKIPCNCQAPRCRKYLN